MSEEEQIEPEDPVKALVKVVDPEPEEEEE